MTHLHPVLHLLVHLVLHHPHELVLGTWFVLLELGLGFGLLLLGILSDVTRNLEELGQPMKFDNVQERVKNE